MDYFPLFLKLKDQPCLVVGAGEIAARKIDLLARTGARIHVVAKHIGPVVSSMKEETRLTIYERAFSDEDVYGMKLIVSATNDRKSNKHIAAVAHANGIPVNVVDNPDLCSFIFPAIIDRSPLTIAVSTGGVSPVLARLVRSKLESTIPASFGYLAKFAEQFRTLVKDKLTETNVRRIFWEKVLNGSIAEMVLTNRIPEAESALLAELDQTSNQATKGEVYLIGAGPGDPDLLTFRALRLMQQADVVVYDRLVSPQILDMARRDSEKIYVGKQRALHSLPQESINSLLAELALSGKRVARLKGGDPFIFGRGGEEIETLMEQGIHFQVVPGITAASGCSSYAGIPLTHRDHAQSCTFVTGHLKDGSINLDWRQLAAPNQTIVIYMGLVGLEAICQSLIEHGCPSDHPIAIVQQGTTPDQKVITATLSTMPGKVKAADIKPPTLIIIGSVVTLHDKLSWFKHQQKIDNTY